ncbi:ethanolamine utilization cob(I)yrinic acid a,c-diamide adenosyltransferase EutT [Pluralibacter gergoviae]|uniref:ethanolamine utilization cob(I)yrinic acid a,c-diamide adenosyltransferase EutT n=1 Tax=Pluralibacter gergoviae TaxID=61647 RepID=UPI0008DC1660|nr:ethanolamine utilization cob(I)yrinic acid a,c-diamide adenosyltransferase EutT [Pluralibacter gergoviae]EKW6619123.1 ethanolamine utilization cob(I)yrinic acid a,c-diamide adenosyltransferase EutT [Pluralibacter gergoviae]OHY69166.1 cobalamin adenosyltransferase [Pluralibacter gergoviae]
MTFITEDWLRDNFTLSEGSEIHLPADSRMTPSARELIEGRHLQVKFQDRQGRLFVETGSADKATPDLRAVHGLTSRDKAETAGCELCHQPVAVKPDTLTHLNAHVMVAKNDPRLAFRAALDATIAEAVWLQIEFAQTPLRGWLADIRSVLGNIMRADALGEPMAEQRIGELTADELHRLSHQPLKYLGHDHIVPDVSHGRSAAMLNLLRSKIREAEIAAARIYIDAGFQVIRPDIMQALNRLSSAAYVLMVMAVREGGVMTGQALKQALSGGGDHAH